MVGGEPCRGDAADRARFLEELDRSEGLRRVRAAVSGGGADACEACGAEIPAARRAALPSARMCISCAERTERARRGGVNPEESPLAAR
jgi:phage/conjugal plasmid C-4 type zinc finger TraR family protein